MIKTIKGLHYFFALGHIGIISRNYNNNISIKINPETGEIYYRPWWHKLVYMVIFIYRTLKACITWNWNISDNWILSKNKGKFIDYYLYDCN